MIRGFSLNCARWWVLGVIILRCGLPTSVLAAPLSADIQASELPALMRQQRSGDTLLLQRLSLDKTRSSATLQLERFEVFADNARVVVHGDTGETVLQPPKNAYYRGQIEGDSDSQAYLVLHAEGSLRGLIRSAGQYWIMEGETAGVRMTTAPLLRQIDPTTEFRGRSFQCGNGQLDQLTHSDLQSFLDQGLTPPRETPQADMPLQLITHTARLAIETDWEFFQKFGNATAATNYIGDLWGYSSMVYGSQIDTSLLVSYVSLWSTTNDPWQQTNTLCGLYEFGKYWNANRSNIQRTTAHFLSGKNNGGGVAWIGVLCEGSFNVNIGSSCSGLSSSDNYGGAYGYSGDLDGNFNINNPGIVWDIVVVSHELGHNFNSPHTHCYAGIGGNPSPVDQCYGSEPGCYSGPRILPGSPGQGSGTLMSYCHLLSPGLSNLSFTFGEGHSFGVAPDRVPTRMSSYVSDTAAANPSCLALPSALRIGNVSKAEGNAGVTPFVFPVTLSPASAGTVTVNYATANGSATAGSDYTAVPTTPLTFTPGQTSKTVVVNVTGDTAKEANEAFVVNLATPNGATIADGQGVGTILNDDGPLLRISDVSKGEGNSGVTPFVFTVTLTPASASPVTVNYATANGTAIAGSDYAAASGALTFSAGQTSKTVTVNVAGDTVKEANETFLVNLSGATGATLFKGQGIGTILNDEGPVLRINDVAKAEGNTGLNAFTFTVTLLPASTSSVTVHYATANGTATAGSDYTAASGVLTFSAGQTSKTVTANVAGDTTLEPNEVFVVNLSAPVGATLFKGQGTGTILNDEGSLLRISDVTLPEGNAGPKAFTFQVTLTPASASPVAVSYATANGTALAGSDYTAVPATVLTFTPGQTSKPITVNVTGDATLEPNETFVVNLAGASGATIFDGQGLGTITNDD